jgi:hypothetical protein
MKPIYNMYNNQIKCLNSLMGLEIRTLVSSAYIIISEMGLMFKGKSFIYIIKSKGLNADLWKTP